MKKVAVEACNVSFNYGKTEVLQNLSLRIEPGEFFALLGPSGSGKSTLLRIIAGLDRLGSGRILIDERDVGGVAAHQRDVGMVFQNYALWPHLTVFKNVAFGLVERRLPRAVIARKTMEALELVGLADYGQRLPSQLSGGQQQRVALARTVAIEPKVLLLDEPLSNLDKRLRVHMREELKTLQRKLGITTLFVTHDQEEAMTTADRMAVLDKGMLQQVGTAAALFDFPCNQFVADFVGTTNLLNGSVTQSGGDTFIFTANGVGPIVLPRRSDRVPAGISALTFRPHVVNIRVADERVDDSHIWLQGHIESSEFRGEFARYGVRVGEIRVTADRQHLSGLPMFPIGVPVRLGIQPSQMRFLAA